MFSMTETLVRKIKTPDGADLVDPEKFAQAQRSKNLLEGRFDDGYQRRTGRTTRMVLDILQHAATVPGDIGVKCTTYAMTQVLRGCLEHYAAEFALRASTQQNPNQLEIPFPGRPVRIFLYSAQPLRGVALSKVFVA